MMNQTIRCNSRWGRRVLVTLAITTIVFGAVNASATWPPPPGGEAVGARYLKIIPGKWHNAFALEVVGLWGDFGDPSTFDVTCFSAYVQADGRLGPDPVYQTNVEWGDEVYAYGEGIVPGSYYTARARDPQTGTGAALILARTYDWGDLDNDRDVDDADFKIFLDIFWCPVGGTAGCTAGDFGGPDGCSEPDGWVDILDYIHFSNAYSGQEFPCVGPCPPPPPPPPLKLKKAPEASISRDLQDALR